MLEKSDSAATRPHALAYRADIDGLRGIAVLAVIAYHAFPRAVPGGFVGVDVFFVISGYLISGILYRDAERGGVDLVGFYARRIRRIFPAVTVMLAAVAALGWLLLTNTDYKELEKHIAAASVFGSNVVLWRESGYFDAPAQFKPLLHLWSLGIEEQFYLLWPPIVYACSLRTIHAGRLASGILAGSLLLNLAIVRAHPAAAFYLPFTRLWELLIGALLALPTGTNRDGLLPRHLASVAAWIGMGLVVAAMAALSGRVRYPGWWALLPTIGTALVIAAGAGSWVNRHVLARRWLVAIGLISYPLYLWHWPLLSFLDIAFGAPSRQMKLAAIGISAILAVFTYLLVERPIRRSMGRQTPFRILALAASLAVVGGVSLYARQTDLFTSGTPNLVAGMYSRLEMPVADPGCRAHFPSEVEYCQQFREDLPVTTALVGDSHAGHFLAGLGTNLARKGENVVHLGHSGCPPLLDLQRFGDPVLESFSDGVVDSCRASNNSVVAVVANAPQLRRVILSFNGAIPVNGSPWNGLGGYETFELAGTLLSSRESIRVGLERTVRLLVERQKEVWIFLQIPELGFHLNECFRRPLSFGGQVRTPCAVARGSVAARQASYRQIVFQVKEAIPDLRVFDPWPYLCDQEWCHAIVDGALLYADDNHLSREGSLFFADKFPF